MFIGLLADKFSPRGRGGGTIEGDHTIGRNTWNIRSTCCLSFLLKSFVAVVFLLFLFFPLLCGRAVTPPPPHTHTHTHTNSLRTDQGLQVVQCGLVELILIAELPSVMLHSDLYNLVTDRHMSSLPKRSIPVLQLQQLVTSLTLSHSLPLSRPLALSSCLSSPSPSPMP